MAFIVALGASPATAQPPTSQPVHIGSRRELFVDRLLIGRLAGTEMKLHPLTPAKPRCPDIAGYYQTVLRDGDLFRAYWRESFGRHKPAQDKGGLRPHEWTCYAQSPDGIHWTRPTPVSYTHLRAHET